MTTKRIPIDRMRVEIKDALDLDKQDVKNYTVAVAFDALQKAQREGSLLDPIQLVDNNPGKPITQVKYGGRITYRDAVEAAEILEFIFRELVALSPVDEGDYSDSHRIMVNGRERNDPRLLAEPGDVISFYSNVLYAKKIEEGQSLQAPRGVYEVVARKAKNRFKGNMAIKFTYTYLAGFSTVFPTINLRFQDNRRGSVI